MVNRYKNKATLACVSLLDWVSPNAYIQSKMHIIYPTAEDVAGAMLRHGDIPIYAGSLNQKGYRIGSLIEVSRCL